MKQLEKITRRYHHNQSNRRIDEGTTSAIPELEDEIINNNHAIHNNMSANTVNDDGRPRIGRRRGPHFQRRNQFSYYLIQRKLKVYLRRNPEKVYVVATAIFVGAWLICWALSTLIAQHRQQVPLDRRRPEHQQPHHPRHDIDGGDTSYDIPQALSIPLPLDSYDKVESDVDGTPLNLSSKKRRDDKKAERLSDLPRNSDRTIQLVPKSDKRTLKTLDTSTRLSDRRDHDVASDTQESKVNIISKAPPKAATTLKAERIPVQVQNRGPSFEVIFPSSVEPNKSSNLIQTNTVSLFLLPEDMDPAIAEDGRWIDFGGLDLKFFEDDRATRQIGRDFRLLETDFIDSNSNDYSRNDDVDTYYAFDDDIIRNEFVEEHQPGQEGKLCRRVAEHRLNFQNCNTFHEIPLVESNVRYLNEGAYRQVVSIDHAFAKEEEKIAMKDISYKLEVQYDTLEYTRIDASIAERLTLSPRIYDIYGMCGVGIMSEFFPHGDFEQYAMPDEDYLSPIQIKESMLTEVKSHNDLSSHDKLKYALHMAEAISDLHGYEFGVMVHQDIQLSQYLWTSDRSRLKLNDFNRGGFMLWSEEEQQYCKYTEGPGNGNWRSPEEYRDSPLDEKVDVFALGNNMYSLLTGLSVFYDESNVRTVQARVKRGDTAYIDPRYKKKSLAEAKLAEIIARCHHYDPADRPSIFEIVAFLTDALKEVEKHEEQSVDGTKS